MKKALGIVALTAAAAAYVAYRIGKEEPTEEEKIVHDKMTSTDQASQEELSNQILKNAGMDDEQVTIEASRDFEHLSDEDIKKIVNDSELELARIKETHIEGERPIQHLIKFEDENNQTAFKEKVIDQGYVVTNGNNDNLIVLHISKLNRDDILGQVFFLADLAKSMNGNYQGWSVK